MADTYESSYVFSYCYTTQPESAYYYICVLMLLSVCVCVCVNILYILYIRIIDTPHSFTENHMCMHICTWIG